MKITTQQLRQIIAEEIQKTVLNETMSPELFQKMKVTLLNRTLELIGDAIRVLQDLASAEIENMGSEEDTDVRSAVGDLEQVRDFVQGILNRK